MRFGQHVQVRGPLGSWTRARFLREERGRHWWLGDATYMIVAVRFAGSWVRVRLPYNDVRA